MNVPLLRDGDSEAPTTIVLAHGAGAAMDSPFMTRIATGLAASGAAVVRFEFPYMRARREEAKRGGPDRPDVLLATYRAVVAQLSTELAEHARGSRIVIGGKSMGGRIASMVADELGVAGLVCLGYPFHPAGKPTQLRVDHLRTLQTPALFVQGTRDALGSFEDVQSYGLPQRLRFCWLDDGDHSFKPRKKSGRTEPQAMLEAVDAVTSFVHSL